jgi:hypothetical protein
MTSVRSWFTNQRSVVTSHGDRHLGHVLTRGRDRAGSVAGAIEDWHHPLPSAPSIQGDIHLTDKYGFNSVMKNVVTCLILLVI